MNLINVKIKIIRFTYKPPSIIYYIFSKIFLLANKNFNNDFLKILNIIDSNTNNKDNNLIENLVMAEDHRYFLHYGVDYISIIRALRSIIFLKKYQGASTIEQQLTRVITYRYERTFRRKIREQLLSILISKYRDKYSIASAYLSIAYFGYKFKGHQSLHHYFLYNNIENKNSFTAAILKYPIPKANSSSWNRKIKNRINYIKKRHEIYKDYLNIKY